MSTKYKDWLNAQDLIDALENQKEIRPKHAAFFDALLDYMRKKDIPFEDYVWPSEFPKIAITDQRSVYTAIDLIRIAPPYHQAFLAKRLLEITKRKNFSVDENIIENIKNENL